MAMCYHSQELHPSTAPNLKLLIKRCKQKIKERNVKVLFVGAGASGVALSSILAFACKQRRGFVRKEGEIDMPPELDASALIMWNQAVELYKHAQSPYEMLEYIDLCSYLNGWGWASPLAVAWGG